MAGSFKHVTDDEGRLLSPEDINSMLECTSGDVVECVTEMYGMIWYLVGTIAKITGIPKETIGRELILREAEQFYRQGLDESPGVLQ